jgi:A/G-specific adenine glycosylase
LPGVGSYTSGAIAAIAYDERQAAMDANAERVIARLFAVETPLPKAKIELHRHAMELVPERAGDFAQALMDLGSAICTPKRPACARCPLEQDCAARKRGNQENLPLKAPKMARPLKRGAAFVARDRSGAVLLVKRPAKGLLASMLEPPLGPWTEKFPSTAQAMKQVPFEAVWKKRTGIVRHGFTHFELEVEVYFAEIDSHPPLEGGSKFAEQISGRGKSSRLAPSPKNSRIARANFSASPSRGEAKWVLRDQLAHVALPTVMRKIVEHGLDDGGPLFAARPVKKRHTSSARRR